MSGNWQYWSNLLPYQLLLYFVLFYSHLRLFLIVFRLLPRNMKNDYRGSSDENGWEMLVWIFISSSHFSRLAASNKFSSYSQRHSNTNWDTLFIQKTIVLFRIHFIGTSLYKPGNCLAEARRPKLRWLDSIENDLKLMRVKRWRKTAEDRLEVHESVHRHTTMTITNKMHFID
jgi:hypothetical protein